MGSRLIYKEKVSILKGYWRKWLQHTEKSFAGVRRYEKRILGAFCTLEMSPRMGEGRTTRTFKTPQVKQMMA
jgi:hypothetical protein